MIEQIKAIFISLGFTPEQNKKGIFLKTYKEHNNYILRINFEKEEIIYGDKIQIESKTTSNFSSPENFVVFECVDRLLEKGYSPENITLERTFPLGHKLKGRLDISVADNSGETFLMIECKTWGNEYKKELNKILKTGGQLFSYLQQDKSTKYLCLYTSRLENNVIEFNNSIIKVEPTFLEANTVKDTYNRWNKNFKDNGIFESWASTYNIVSKALRKKPLGALGGLKPLTKEDSGKIFNQFAEILRHNVVSDKPNAFNKLITLLLCKIVDEDRNEDEEYAFQWLEDDSNTALQKRLNDLYKVGMKNFLAKAVTDYSDDDIDKQFSILDQDQRDAIKNIMTELRLKKNNEFAFKEVFNQASFEENSKVLKEVIELLQPYQVRYTTKQQFLGDFFELLLTTSIKQEAGQFFTPVPVARFIVNSIPFRKIIDEKIKKQEIEYLPFVLDYAAGSGHFITEAMDEIHAIILELRNNNKLKQSIKNELVTWSDLKPFEWANKYIYGIEKDYRLVKTAKVSCFLNGDGLARIINADGLGNFHTEPDYADKLKTSLPTQDNQQFDIIVANPPYSVDAFKNTLVNVANSFELYDKISDTSSEIECLFVERTKQLLNDGGYTGIILPPAILTNGGIYETTRELIFKYFRIVGIVQLGSKTFMATQVDTSVLFLQRKSEGEWKKVNHVIESFFKNRNDVSSNGIENIFSKYVSHVYKNISFQDYINLITKSPTKALINHEIFINYQEWFNGLTEVIKLKERAVSNNKTEDENEIEITKLFFEKVLEIEKRKLFYFLTAYTQKVIFADTNPNNNSEEEKKFLGYEISARRGKEGLRPIKHGAKIEET